MMASLTPPASRFHVSYLSERIPVRYQPFVLHDGSKRDALSVQSDELPIMVRGTAKNPVRTSLSTVSTLSGTLKTRH